MRKKLLKGRFCPLGPYSWTMLNVFMPDPPVRLVSPLTKLFEFNPDVRETHVVWALFMPHMGLFGACFVGIPSVKVQFLIL